AAAPQRGKPARDAAGAESAAKAGGGEGPYVPVVHALPARDAGALAVVDEGVEVAAIVQAGVRREAPFVFQVIDEAVDPVTHRAERGPAACRGGHQKRLSASATSSPSRARKSKLIAGWKRCASLLPMARKPSSQALPSGTSAAEPTSSAAGPNRNCFWASRTWPQRGVLLSRKV